MDMLRFSGGSAAPGRDSTRPPTVMVPSSGTMNPAISRSVVVLPQPDGPSRHTRSSCGMERSMPSATVRQTVALADASQLDRGHSFLPAHAPLTEDSSRHFLSPR